jgi:hypothetical protein
MKAELIDDSTYNRGLYFKYIQFYKDSIALIDGQFDDWTDIYFIQTEYSDTSLKMKFIKFDESVIYADHDLDVKVNFISNDKIELIESFSNFKIVYYLNRSNTNELNEKWKNCKGVIRRFDKPIKGEVSVH